MSDARGCERSNLDRGEAGDRGRDVRMDSAMEMTTAVTPTAAGEIKFQPMERNNNGNRRRRSEAPAAPSDWRSRMERTMGRQGHKLTHLH